MHRTLKEQTASPPRASERAQQRAFDLFRRQYNDDRPHQALQQRTPSSLYQCSERQLAKSLPQIDYPFADDMQRVDKHGRIQWGRRKIYISRALYGEDVGGWIIDDGRWEVCYGPVVLGYIDRKKPRKKLIPPKQGWKVSTMSSVQSVNDVPG